MHLSISNNARFKADCEHYQLQINDITDLQKKNHLTNLLAQLVEEATSVDRMHDNLISGITLIPQDNQSRLAISSIRKDLDRILSKDV